MKPQYIHDKDFCRFLRPATRPAFTRFNNITTHRKGF